MSLRDRTWSKEGFYPPTSDLVNSLFIPALEESVRYDRITGDFSSAILTLLTGGLEDFIDQGGKIRLIPGAELQEEDVKAIEKGYSDDTIKESIDWGKVKKGMKEEVLEALAWLISNGHLEVRVGINKSGKWHEKMAIFTDREGNVISTMGSPNESFRAFKRNTELLQLYKSWEEPNKVESYVSHFEDTWDSKNLPDNQEVIDFTAALENDMIEYMPDSEPDWSQFTQKESESQKTIPAVVEDPRSYQKEAIEKITENDNNLLVEHPTGTGKTWTALFTLKDILDSEDIVLVSAPKKTIVDQWIGENEEENLAYFFPNCKKIRCQGGENWRNQLFNHLNADRDSPLFLISTMHPSTLESVFEMLEDQNVMDKTVFIADEVHNIGSPGRRKVLQNYKPKKARIGLSATLERDDDGDDVIWSYFGDRKDKITFEEAVNSYDVLSDYKLHIHEVSLTEEELKDYKEKTNQIRNKYHRLKKYEGQPIGEISDENDTMSSLLNKRAAILKRAEEKIMKSEEILQSTDYDKTLIFCPKKTEKMFEIRNKYVENTEGIVYDNYHSEQDSETQINVLADFERGKTDALLSMDCLNEGIDVPSCDSAIIISSSTSEREMIQRRGRVLRKSETKRYANIHEFLVYPAPKQDIIDGKASLSDSSISLLEKELERIKTMNKEAKNKESNKIDIYDVEKVLNMADT